MKLQIVDAGPFRFRGLTREINSGDGMSDVYAGLHGAFATSSRRPWGNHSQTGMCRMLCRGGGPGLDNPLMPSFS